MIRILSTGLIFAAIAMAGSTANPPAITFYEDVLPVLQTNGKTCHRPGEAAPMSFLTYDSTGPWANAMKTAVLTKQMPPWFADPQAGKFSNDRTLSQADINILVAWADTEAAAGDVKDAPAPLNFVEGWRIGKPDLVLEVPNAFHVPAQGTIDYQYVVVPAHLTADK